MLSTRFPLHSHIFQPSRLLKPSNSRSSTILVHRGQQAYCWLIAYQAFYYLLPVNLDHYAKLLQHVETTVPVSGGRLDSPRFRGPACRFNQVLLPAATGPPSLQTIQPVVILCSFAFQATNNVEVVPGAACLLSASLSLMCYGKGRPRHRQRILGKLNRALRMALSPPAIIPTTISNGTPNVGGTPEASTT